MKKLLKYAGTPPRVMITDKLRSYVSAPFYAPMQLSAGMG
ncbi:hypothetical protein NK6_2912 [Bradyrhizobium diazoefficiens]|uniref:Transposase n=1 Tax=Bradyrhizobium diazoefficiens TaxID=1355477 RepID=A0A0E4BNC0_9BRAD|nr:hypothetical protein NK6_2912 [Bradyrhizobium diazoefficiens]